MTRHIAPMPMRPRPAALANAWVPRGFGARRRRDAHPLHEASGPARGAVGEMRAAVVACGPWRRWGRTIGLGDHLYLGRGEETTGGRDGTRFSPTPSRPVIGAVYITRWNGAAAALVTT